MTSHTGCLLEGTTYFEARHPLAVKPLWEDLTQRFAFKMIPLSWQSRLTKMSAMMI